VTSSLAILSAADKVTQVEWLTALVEPKKSVIKMILGYYGTEHLWGHFLLTTQFFICLQEDETPQ